VVPPGSGVKTVTSSTTISINCSAGASISVALGEGLNPTGSGMTAKRQLKATAASVTYELFQDSGRSQTWGDGTFVGPVEAGFGDGTAQPFPVFASVYVPAGAAIGSYSDSVVVTVTF